MSKIRTIKISNFKAISEFEADFKGCTAIVTAGNNKGKTSFLKGIPDRVRFIRPDVMVTKGATKGKGELTLTTGEKFLWEFDDARMDKLTFVSKDNIRQNVTKELGARYFPPTFDIDKFLQSSPKEQAKQLQKIIGIDFTEIDAKYQRAYDERTTRNIESEKYHVKLSAMLKVDKVDSVDLTALQSKQQAEKDRLNKLYLSNKVANDTARNEWNEAKKAIDAKCDQFNQEQNTKKLMISTANTALETIVKCGYEGKEVEQWLLKASKAILPLRIADELYPAEPKYITPELPERTALDAIDAEILAASETNEKARQYKEYIDYTANTEAAKELADEADAKVKAIEQERNTMIASANFPKGISINSDGIMIDGFPLDRNQISTSKLYCAALRIASMNLGEVKTLYFDASFLDRNSLSEIEVWANENDLQLLIERPDYEGGEIKYEIIENQTTNAAQTTLL